MNEFEMKIRDKAELLKECNGDYNLVHQSLKEKRLRWYEENKDRLKEVLKGPLPKQAFQMVLFEYMKADPKEIPIIYEDEDQITWASYNFCPYLEAIKELNLDTREVCKDGLEESVQDLIKCLDPRLKFSRDYKNLRPYGNCCIETIKLINGQ